jgi:hypothetical protein
MFHQLLCQTEGMLRSVAEALKPVLSRLAPFLLWSERGE